MDVSGALKRQNKKRNLFGTDGIRGMANRYPMTSEIALKLGRAVAEVFRSEPSRSEFKGKRGSKASRRHRILIGKDTRISGYMIETALASGICSMGVDVLLVGPLPTPAVAFLTRSMRVDAGVVISASHNPFQDNGIKFFSSNGFKLPDAIEEQMEKIVFRKELESNRPTASNVGKASRISDAIGRTKVFLKNAFPRHLTLDGLKIVVDCAHGAAYRIAPEVLSELGGEIIPVGIQPDGENINRDCGALHIETAQKVLIQHGADLAISLDGDGDRAIFVDEKGEVVDGDEILAICARGMMKNKTLKTDTIVATVMSNFGLDLAMGELGIKVVRAPVGDRYVVEEMIRNGCNLGGEQSGHVVFLDYNTTGDGCITALQILAMMVDKERTLGELKQGITKLPQVLLNVGVKEKRSLSRFPRVQERIAKAEKELGPRGRVLVRYSGTESLARIMLEGEDKIRIQRMATEIAEEIRSQLGSD